MERTCNKTYFSLEVICDHANQDASSPGAENRPTKKNADGRTINFPPRDRTFPFFFSFSFFFFSSTQPSHHINQSSTMAGGKFKKPQRGGGRTFSRRIEAVHTNNAVCALFLLVLTFLPSAHGKRRGPKNKSWPCGSDGNNNDKTKQSAKQTNRSFPSLFS